MPASLRALLAQSIDYAGMFPPCSLDLEPALKKQADYVRSPDAWMLSTFVLPVAQFDAVAKSILMFDRKHPFRASALGPKTENASAFRLALKETVEAMRAFSVHHCDRAAISQLEMLIPPDVDLKLLAEARAMIGDMQCAVYWEAPVESAERVIELLAEHTNRKNTGGRSATSCAQAALPLMRFPRRRRSQPLSSRRTSHLHQVYRRLASSAPAIP